MNVNHDYFEKEVYSENEIMDLEKLVSQKITKSLVLMFFGLMATIFTGILFVTVAPKFLTYDMLGGLIIVASAVTIAVVIIFSFKTYTAKTSTLKKMFWIYSILNGITLSVFIMAYELSSVVFAFLSTVILFAVLAAYGYFTKKDLTKMGPFLFASLIALLIIGILNIFMRSESLIWISSFAGAGIFMLYTAYDINRIKSNVIACAIYQDSTILERVEVIGALALYLDFVNLFINILRIVGRRR